MAIGGVDAWDGAAGHTLRSAFAVHEDAEAGVGQAEHAVAVAGAAGPTTGTVVGAGAERFAEDVVIVALALGTTGSVVCALRTLVFVSGNK